MIDYVTEPLDTPEKARPYVNDGGYVSVVVKASLYDAIDADLEGWLDTISELAVGAAMLMDVNYELVGTVPDEAGAMLIRVTGDTSAVWGDEDDGDDE